MDLSIIVVNYNTKDLLIKCLDSIITNTKKIRYEIIIVDNNSEQDYVEAIKMYVKGKPFVKTVFNKENLGFGVANNQGMKLAKGDFILLLNSDTRFVNKDTLDEIISWMRDNPSVGVFSCALLNNDGSIQGTGGYFPDLLRVFSWMTIQDLPFVDSLIKPFHPMKERSFLTGKSFYAKERELDWLTGAFFLLRKEVVHKIGGFDNEYFMYTEEVDYCYRIKKLGWKVYYNPRWKIIHLGGASSDKEYSILNEFKGVKIFYRKHYPSWQFPILRLFLKLGSFGRMFLFGVINGRESFNTYAKAFKFS